MENKAAVAGVDDIAGMCCVGCSHAMALSSLEAMPVEKDGRQATAVDKARVPDVSAAEGMFAGFISQAVRGEEKELKAAECLCLCGW